VKIQVGVFDTQMDIHLSKPPQRTLMIESQCHFESHAEGMPSDSLNVVRTYGGKLAR
jgi:hypothetical protein